MTIQEGFRVVREREGDPINLVFSLSGRKAIACARRVSHATVILVYVLAPPPLQLAARRFRLARVASSFRPMAILQRAGEEPRSAGGSRSGDAQEVVFGSCSQC